VDGVSGSTLGGAETHWGAWVWGMGAAKEWSAAAHRGAVAVACRGWQWWHVEGGGSSAHNGGVGAGKHMGPWGGTAIGQGKGEGGTVRGTYTYYILTPALPHRHPNTTERGGGGHIVGRKGGWGKLIWEPGMVCFGHGKGLGTNAQQPMAHVMGF